MDVEGPAQAAGGTHVIKVKDSAQANDSGHLIGSRAKDLAAQSS
jgi:hypothetical protein